MNDETKYLFNIIISMIPVGIVGVFFKDTVEEIFGSGLLIVGIMLLVTAALLIFSYYAKPRQKETIVFVMPPSLFGAGHCGDARTEPFRFHDS